tara:strand:+ start:484 stop:933 length:450 start_codon:yes stop_codon:yes gene_type:complete
MDNSYKSQDEILVHQDERRKTMARIEARALAKRETRLIRTRRSNNWRIFIGLPLVQGSSLIALYDMPMMWYWSLLWVGLLVYLGTSIRLCKEAWDTHRETKAKFESGQGSSDLTVRHTKEKRRSEIAYIIGNFAGLVLVGSNIYMAMIG